MSVLERNPAAPPRLLVIDDTVLALRIAANTLQHAGFAVETVNSGPAALEAFAAQRFDAVLLDLVMPDMDGFEVCQRIRALPHGASVPILMFTGRNDTESIERAYQLGATDFITKPINWALLSHRVRYALRASAAAEATRRAADRLVRAQRAASLGNWMLTPDGGAELSDELLRILDMDPGSHPLSQVEIFFQHVVPEDQERVLEALNQLRQHGVPLQVQFRFRRRDGQLRTLHSQGSTVLDDNGHVIGLEGITQDITERVEANERIRRLAEYDDTTGLPNRKLFADLATPVVERATRHRETGALFFVDIDLFKAVNDAFGRNVGDAVLKEVAERLRAWTPQGDGATGERPADRPLLACAGGDAFTLLVPNLAGQEQASEVAEQLLQVLARPIAVESQSLVLTASIGIAFYPSDAATLPELMLCAEQSVHAAKHSGRALHRFFNQQMNALATRRLRLETELRRAIECNELRLHFQPKVDAKRGAIVGAEALVRWQHPERGLVPPGEFVPLAEESGLILPLTRWVLEAACRHLRKWSDAGLPTIPLSVNLAAPSLSDCTLIEQLDTLMLRHDLAPGVLMLEITETLLMRDVQAGIAMLGNLRARGYGLSLDDFGTGYSSLSYLKRFQVDELKIDRAFVTDITHDSREGTLAAAIIALGHELGLKVVAEGVEAEAQSAFLLSRGCTVQQGNFFSPAVPAEQFERLAADTATRGRGSESDAAVTAINRRR
jgi:diguanylate cyclase (GGDEF)-like protein